MKDYFADFFHAVTQCRVNISLCWPRQSYFKTATSSFVSWRAFRDWSQRWHGHSGGLTSDDAMSFHSLEISRTFLILGYDRWWQGAFFHKVVSDISCIISPPSPIFCHLYLRRKSPNFFSPKFWFFQNLIFIFQHWLWKIEDFTVFVK